VPTTLTRLLSLLAIGACALATFACVPALERPTSKPIGYYDARHFLARTGFGPTAAEVRRYAVLSREEAVAELLRDARASARSSPLTRPPAWATETGALRLPRGESAPPEERQAFRQEQIRNGLELRAWWLSEMLASPSALTERMTLFWHNHFVSSQQKVRFARLMYAQNATFREHALGNFGTLLRAAAKDPAMLIYLDSAQNRKGQPNENFAREVMELFTLGEGSYTENDVKEAARAFTGWSLNRDTGHYQFRPGLHDNGIKTVFARSGHFDGDAVLDLLLARPETAEHLTRKLWREFLSEEPETHEVKRIAQLFRSSNYDIETALRGLLLSDAFWSAGNRGVLIKSPVELVVGALRQLSIDPGPALPLALVSAGMGQNLFSPPNVKGWPGGEAWINTHTLLARKQFLDRLVRADAVPAVWLGTFPGTTSAEQMQAAQALLLPLPPSSRTNLGAGEIPDAMTFVRATLLDPAYQLK